MQYRAIALCGALVLWAGCAGTQEVALKPEAARIEIIKGELDRNEFEYLGDVSGTSKSKDIEAGNEHARNDLRNKAAAMGAEVVILDTNTAANAMDWTGRTQIVLTGRAFRRVSQ